MRKISNNLLRDSIHPQGVGRWVPGGFAATPPLTALHCAHSFAHLRGMSRSLRAVRLALEPLVTVLEDFQNV